MTHWARRLHRRQALGLAGGALLGVSGGRAAAQPPPRLYEPAESFETAFFDGYVVQDPTRVRAIPVRFRYPRGLNAAAPVVVFSHGGGPRPAGQFGNDEWGEALAGAGYLVVHLNHTLGEGEADLVCESVGAEEQCDGETAMTILRPGDASAVIAGLADLVAEHPRLARYFDLDRIGMAGHSAGAYTTMALAGAIADVGAGPVDYSDPTPKTFLALSPQGPGRHGFTEDSWDGIERPVMIVSGAGDVTDGEDALSRRVPFELMPPGDKTLVWLDDRAASHDTFGLENEEQPEMVAWVRAAGLAWLDATLRDRDEAREWLASGALQAISDGVVEIEMK